MITDAVRSAAAKVRPTGERILWFRQEYTHPFLALPPIKTNRGWVLAVGPGKRIRRKVKVQVAPGQFHEAAVGAHTGKVRPMTVKPGDFLEFSQYGQTEFEVDGIKFVLSAEDSVLGYGDENDTQGVLFPAPAGFDDRNRQVVATVSM